MKIENPGDQETGAWQAEIRQAGRIARWMRWRVTGMCLLGWTAVLALWLPYDLTGLLLPFCVVMQCLLFVYAAAAVYRGARLEGLQGKLKQLPAAQQSRIL